MTISELQNKYTQGELSNREGNQQLRYEILSPLFKNLYENKVVYYERDTCIIKLENIEITTTHFKAIAQRQLIIERAFRRNVKREPTETWEVGVKWAYLRLGKNYLASPFSWMMWIEPEFVKNIEQLVIENRHKEALNLTTFTVD